MKVADKKTARQQLDDIILDISWSILQKPILANRVLECTTNSMVEMETAVTANLPMKKKKCYEMLCLIFQHELERLLKI